MIPHFLPNCLLVNVLHVKVSFSNADTSFFSIGNSIVSSAITDKNARVSFLKTAKNSASPKDERYLQSLKNSRVHVFRNCTKNYTITC